MSHTVELANEGIEHAHHEVEHAAPHNDHRARRIAVLIAALAAALAISEMGEKSAQNDYLTRHIALSDDWNFYQAKHTRAVMIGATADVLAGLPPSAATDQRIAALRTAAAKYRERPERRRGGEATARQGQGRDRGARPRLPSLPPVRMGGGRIADRDRAGVGRRGDARDGTRGRRRAAWRAWRRGGCADCGWGRLAGRLGAPPPAKGVRPWNPFAFERPVARQRLLFVVLCLVWGTTWLALKVGVTAVPPAFFSGTRWPWPAWHCSRGGAGRGSGCGCRTAHSGARRWSAC